MGHFDVKGFYNETEAHEPHGFGARDRAVGLGCMGLTIVAFLLAVAVATALIEEVARLWT